VLGRRRILKDSGIARTCYQVDYRLLHGLVTIQRYAQKQLRTLSLLAACGRRGSTSAVSLLAPPCRAGLLRLLGLTATAQHRRTRRHSSMKTHRPAADRDDMRCGKPPLSPTLPNHGGATLDGRDLEHHTTARLRVWIHSSLHGSSSVRRRRLRLCAPRYHLVPRHPNEASEASPQIYTCAVRRQNGTCTLKQMATTAASSPASIARAGFSFANTSAAQSKIHAGGAIQSAPREHSIPV
jgi:hypothetical protein